MTNHPNRKLTPSRRLFLQAAMENGGKIIRPKFSTGWLAGELRVGERVGESLREMGLIAAVKQAGSANTVRAGMGYLYTITEAGRAALASSH